MEIINFDVKKTFCSDCINCLIIYTRIFVWCYFVRILFDKEVWDKDEYKNHCAYVYWNAKFEKMRLGVILNFVLIFLVWVNVDICLLYWFFLRLSSSEITCSHWAWLFYLFLCFYFLDENLVAWFNLLQNAFSNGNLLFFNWILYNYFLLRISLFYFFWSWRN